MFGGIGILTGSVKKWFCIPLFITLQDGVKTIFGWEDGEERQSSHVVQTVEDGFRTSQVFGKSILLLDRYFLSVSALSRLNELNAEGGATMQMVTKAKKSCTAYEHPPKKKPGRGRPPKKGAAIKLKSLFENKRAEFKETTICLYGKDETIRYYCLNLL